ncbi:C40 family peptidase [Bacillus songklensis]|uniref:C40 family peptidase n=1 Tax=Bacillus songklensis TaxID=1069116 RepID=A0ABV8B7U5_9BACI
MKDHYKAGKAVAKKDIREGDLVFFNTNGKGVSFVGISLGSVQSLNTKYWKNSYVGAKRVLN